MGAGAVTTGLLAGGLPGDKATTGCAKAGWAGWLNQAGTNPSLPESTRLWGLKLLSFCMRRLIFSWAHWRISSMLMAPEPSRSRASRNMQSRMYCVASPPFCSSSKLISLLRAADKWMMSCGKAPRLTCSLTRPRVRMFTGLPHISEVPANLGRNAPSSLPFRMPRVRAAADGGTSPPEWQASYITKSLSVFCVMLDSKPAISRLVIVPLLMPS